MQQFEVRKDDLSARRLVTRDPPTLADQGIRLEVERFAFTANNMTYGVAGDFLGYWQFFPASEDGWGQIPVWATARVKETRHPEIAVGERLYGYFPPAEYADLIAGDVGAKRLVDHAPHRQHLPPLYNHYRRLGPVADAAKDNASILLAPLHITSFCLWDVLRSRNWHGAGQILISSASSKTSLGLAYGLKRDDSAPRIIGLTSAGNAAFVKGTGLYDEVLTYDNIEALSNEASVLVDMAGSASLVAAMFAKLGDALVYRYNVGITHGPSAGTPKGNVGGTGAKEMFFAPSYILERVKEWGAAEFDRRSTAFIAGAAEATAGWMEVDERPGLGALEDAYPQFVAGAWPPDRGLVIVP
ncbi:DUF2855 family protein [Sphingomicrobium flavum]|uniref:DUF2855 family protein n=1 Tax=Sphingomicrobium flavum TaxID=1229164 RepID=UPI0021AE153C|nr:DUF2855 family protein [Sphingomicrobium flavum]